MLYLNIFWTPALNVLALETILRGGWLAPPPGVHPGHIRPWGPSNKINNKEMYIKPDRNIPTKLKCLVPNSCSTPPIFTFWAHCSQDRCVICDFIIFLKKLFWSPSPRSPPPRTQRGSDTIGNKKWTLWIHCN